MATIIITGANGFIGNELVNYFHSKGNKVMAFARQKHEEMPDGVEFFNYDLSQPPPEEPFMHADYVIHTAFQIFSTKTKNASSINLKGTQQLLELSEKYNIKKFVYFSSFSAHEGAHSQYGLSKLEIEKTIDITKHIVLKPGLVLGKGGLFNAIRNLISGSSIIPVFAGGKQKVQTVYINDLMRLIEIAFEKNISGTFPLGEKKPLTMKELNKAIAGMSGKKIKFISIPYSIGFLILSVANFLHIKLPISKENIRGLKYGITYDTSVIKDIFGFELRNYDQSLKELS